MEEGASLLQPAVPPWGEGGALLLPPAVPLWGEEGFPCCCLLSPHASDYAFWPEDTPIACSATSRASIRSAPFQVLPPAHPSTHSPLRLLLSDFKGIYQECAQVLYQEIDYINEGRNR